MTAAFHISRKVVLFDVDGVLYKNKQIMVAIQRKISNYVKTRLSNEKRITLSEANQLSLNLYKRYGHTLLGLRSMYSKLAFTIEDFNEYVYDDELINMLGTSLIGSKSSGLNEYVRMCQHNHSNVAFGIFSNAPLCWCAPITSQYNLNVDNSLLYTSSHAIFDQRLKPDISLYNDVAAAILIDNEAPIRYIDDSDVNIAAVASSPEWAQVKFVSWEML
jgi:FMN phosphatase YigB (HAD superfamily)